MSEPCEGKNVCADYKHEAEEEHHDFAYHEPGRALPAIIVAKQGLRLMDKILLQSRRPFVRCFTEQDNNTKRNKPEDNCS